MNISFPGVNSEYNFFTTVKLTMHAADAIEGNSI